MTASMPVIGLSRARARTPEECCPFVLAIRQPMQLGGLHRLQRTCFDRLTDYSVL